MSDRAQLTNIIMVAITNQHMLNKNTIRYTSLAADVLDLIRKPSTGTLGGGLGGTSVVGELYSIVETVVADGLGKPIDVNSLVVQLRTSLAEFPDILTQLERNLLAIPVKEEMELDNDITLLGGHLEKWINVARFNKVLSQYAFNYQEGDSREDHFAALTADILPYLKDTSSIRQASDIPGVVGELMMSSENSFKEVWLNGRDEEDEGTVSAIKYLTTDIDGWNVSLGEGGFQHPSVTLINALTGTGKSDSLQRIIRGICRTCDGNDYVTTPGKKPLIVHITAENTLEGVVQAYYHDWCGEVDGVRRENLGWRECYDYLKGTMLKSNWDIWVISVGKDTRSVSISDIDKLLSHAEEKGYQIVVGLVDYLQKLNWRGCVGDNESAQLMTAAGELETIFKTQRGASLFQAAQLAATLKTARNSCDDFARRYGPELSTAYCKGLGNEFDYAVTVNVQAGDDGKFYHEWHVDKNRLSKTVTPADGYSVYRMCTLDSGVAGGFIAGDIADDGTIDSQSRVIRAGALRSGAGDNAFTF